MTAEAFGTVLRRQAELIAALDARDADAILAASNALGSAVEQLRTSTAAVEKATVDYGLKQSDAARIRVKYLTAWNRQKIDRLAELRGQVSAGTYTNPRVSAR